MLFTVTQVCRSFSQPRGGFIRLSEFEQIPFAGQTILNTSENISPGLVGMTVDYMTRFSMGFPLSKSFQTSIQGAYNISMEAFRLSAQFGKNIKGLDDISIINSCKLVSFDDAFRLSRIGGDMPPLEAIDPDQETIDNIRILINRSIHFWNQYGPITEIGFTFESPEQKKKGSRDHSSLEAFISGGYTLIVANGEGDYLTKDTLWDFKVSKTGPRTRDTLQLLMYWIMGRHSGQDVYKGIKRIGIFNPRLNTAYLLDVNRIPAETIRQVEKDVIGYPIR